MDPCPHETQHSMPSQDDRTRNMTMDPESRCVKDREGAKSGTDDTKSKYMKGVRRLWENGISEVPPVYILPLPDRPNNNAAPAGRRHLKLPVIDLGRLRTAGGRARALDALDRACREYGFFQVVNHGIGFEVLQGMREVGKRFFELPFEERAKYMSNNIREPVRYGTSFNQMNDGVFYWRDFLKLNCQPLDAVLPFWPSSPPELREEAEAYVRQVRSLFLVLMSAVLDALGLDVAGELKEFDRGSHLMVVNYYPECPQPDLTLGMPAHSDYGFLTLLLQDDVEGLQVQCADDWITVEPIPGSFVVNVGDHLEIFSNGIYKSPLHRVLVNSSRPRVSVASFHSLPYEKVVRPSPGLVDGAAGMPRRYKDTDFAAFLDYISSHELKNKNFLESRKLTST